MIFSSCQWLGVCKFTINNEGHTWNSLLFLLPGFRLSNSTFNALVQRYSHRDGKIYFDDMIHCIVRLKTMFGRLLQLDCTDFWCKTVVVAPEDGMCKVTITSVKQSHVSLWRRCTRCCLDACQSTRIVAPSLAGRHASWTHWGIVKPHGTSKLC